MAFRSVPRPSSPPDAKASTECPYHAQSLMDHLQKPSCTETIHSLRRKRSHSLSQFTLTQHTTGFYPSIHVCTRTGRQNLSNASEHSRSNRWRPLLRTTLPVRRTVRPRTITPGLHPADRNARPETHQNLIYPDKEQQHRRPKKHLSTLSKDEINGQEGRIMMTQPARPNS